MITDNAPIPALIQRMGRVNRFIQDDKDSPKEVYVVKTANHTPYEESELQNAEKWVSFILKESNVVSQSDLDNVFRGLETDEDEIPMNSSWLDGGPFSKPGELRESGYTISVIMYEDLHKVKKNGKVINSELVKFTIPMLFDPVSSEIAGWQRLNGVFVAPKNRIEYCSLRGGKWRILIEI